MSATTARTSATDHAKDNGTGDAPQILPVDSFKDAASFLRRPFTDRAVKFKVQATWPKDNPESGLIVSYIDARLVVERLNMVCPHLWDDDYKELSDNRLLCLLTVDGITRQDIGTGYQGKGLYSDALKRAGVKFGIGVSLYATPKIILGAGQHLEKKTTGGKKTLVLKPAGETRCRKLYSEWLEAQGIPAFGEPLDHGDVPDAVGDPAEHEQAQDAPQEAADAKLPKARADKLEEIVKAAGLEKDLPVKLRGFGAKSLTDLTEQQAIGIYEWCSNSVEAAEAS